MEGAERYDITDMNNQYSISWVMIVKDMEDKVRECNREIRRVRMGLKGFKGDRLTHQILTGILKEKEDLLEGYKQQVRSARHEFEAHQLN